MPGAPYYVRWIACWTRRPLRRRVGARAVCFRRLVNRAAFPLASPCVSLSGFVQAQSAGVAADERGGRQRCSHDGTPCARSKATDQTGDSDRRRRRRQGRIGWISAPVERRRVQPLTRALTAARLTPASAWTIHGPHRTSCEASRHQRPQLDGGQRQATERSQRRRATGPCTKPTGRRQPLCRRCLELSFPLAPPLRCTRKSLRLPIPSLHPPSHPWLPQLFPCRPACRDCPPCLHAATRASRFCRQPRRWDCTDGPHRSLHRPHRRLICRSLPVVLASTHPSAAAASSISMNGSCRAVVCSV